MFSRGEGESEGQDVADRSSLALPLLISELGWMNTAKKKARVSDGSIDQTIINPSRQGCHHSDERRRAVQESYHNDRATSCTLPHKQLDICTYLESWEEIRIVPSHHQPGSRLVLRPGIHLLHPQKNPFRKRRCSWVLAEHHSWMGC